MSEADRQRALDSERRTTHRESRGPSRLLLPLLALLAFLSCAGVHHSAQASVAPDQASQGSADATHQALTTSDDARWSEHTSVPEERELSATEPEDFEKDTALETTAVELDVLVTQVAAFPSTAILATDAARVPQAQVACVLARGPPQR